MPFCFSQRAQASTAAEPVVECENALRVVLNGNLLYSFNDEEAYQAFIASVIKNNTSYFQNLRDYLTGELTQADFFEFIRAEHPEVFSEFKDFKEDIDKIVDSPKYKKYERIRKFFFGSSIVSIAGMFVPLIVLPTLGYLDLELPRSIMLAFPVSYFFAIISIAGSLSMNDTLSSMTQIDKIPEGAVVLSGEQIKNDLINAITD